MMNVEEMIQVLRIRPGMYLIDLKLSYVYQFIGGFLYNNIATDNADEVDRYFKSEFYGWVTNWILEKKGLEEDRAYDWLQILSNISENNQEAINLFFYLCDKFFSEFHRK